MKIIIYISFLFVFFFSCNGTKKLNKTYQKDNLLIKKEPKLLLKHNLKTINFNNNSIFSFSDYVVKSKVSIFIIGSKYCSPCKVLEKKVVEKYFEKDLKVNLFKINVPTKEDKKYKSLGYKVFRDIDGLSEIQPTTVIFSPTKNQYAIYKGLETKSILNDIELLKKFCK